MARYRFLTVLSLIIGVSWAGCATAPKPQELIGLEQLLEARRTLELQDKQAELVAESRKAYKSALEAWEDDEMELAKHWAQLGAIKYRTAQAIVQQEESSQRLLEVKKQNEQVQAEAREVEEKIRAADEKVLLYEKLATARSATLEKEMQLSETQKLADAQKAVAAAQLALKKAETVNAVTYAESAFNVAQAMLNKAEAALKVQNASDASASAQLAKEKAEVAYAAAREPYMQAQEAASRQAQNQALQRDASGIPNVTVKLESAGGTQRLILPVLDLFKPRSTAPRPDKVATLNTIGELLKKFPSYPVIINGFTSYRVGGSQRYAVSQSRAQQVANHFVNMGIPLKRFAVSGLAAENLIARKWSTLNDRVEIVFLFE